MTSCEQKDGRIALRPEKNVRGAESIPPTSNPLAFFKLKSSHFYNPCGITPEITAIMSKTFDAENAENFEDVRCS